MKLLSQRNLLIAMAFSGALIAGCAANNTGSTRADSASAAPSTPKGPGPGMNAKGEVVDSSKVEGGYGKTVKGRGDWEGEITGVVLPNSKFAKLQIGMSMREAVDNAGQPTDQGAYMTGKAWIPFYFGSDRHRYEMTFKGQGRLIFAGGSLGNLTGGNLIWIIHNPSESGYR